MDSREFRETLAQGEPLREAHVEGDIIHNVALLGPTSLNNRIYTEQAMKDAAKLYNGAPVYIDHPTESEMEDRQGVRSVMDLAGRVLRSRIAGEQVRGDIQVLDREPTKGLFLARDRVPYGLHGGVRAGDVQTAVKILDGNLGPLVAYAAVTRPHRRPRWAMSSRGHAVKKTRPPSRQRWRGGGFFVGTRRPG